MTQDTLDPTLDSVLSKLAELTVTLESPQQQVLQALVAGGHPEANKDGNVGAEAPAVAPAESDFAEVAAKVFEIRESMTADEQAILDVMVMKATGAPEPEVKGHAWYQITSITAPRGMNAVYSGYCRQFDDNYCGRWSSTTLTQYTAHSWSAFSTYTCWGWA